MAIACAVLATLGFIGLLAVLRVVERAREAMSGASRAVAELRAAGSDDERERISRQGSLAIARLFAVIAGSVLIAAAAPLAVVYGLDRLSLVSLARVLAVMASPIFIAGSVAAGLVAWALLRARKATLSGG